eukprot:3251226-Pyramimonas_sp.AAC.1
MQRGQRAGARWAAQCHSPTTAPDRRPQCQAAVGVRVPTPGTNAGATSEGQVPRCRALAPQQARQTHHPDRGLLEASNLEDRHRRE